MSSLDDLLSALQDPVPSAGSGSSGAAKSKPMATDELDSLLEGLAAPIQPSTSTTSKPAAAAPSQAPGDDLDNLLNRLTIGAKSPPAPVKEKKPARPVSNDDLDDLLNGLGSPAAPKKTGAAVPAAAPAKVTVSSPVVAKATTASKPADDLDSLLDDLAGPAPAAKKVAASPAAAKKVVTAPPSTSNGSPAAAKKVAASPAAPKKAAASGGADDLDSLLGELSGSTPSGAKKVAAAPPKPAEDLDSLMADLGGGTVKAKPAFTVSSVPAPASKKDDLDDLMASLDSRPAPASTSSTSSTSSIPSSPATKPAGRAGANQGRVDELDNLMSSLGGPATPSTKPAQKKDDLDDLMNSLGGPLPSSSPSLRPGHPSGAAPSRARAESRFDDLVSTITQDMNDLNSDQGGRSRGVCYHCRQPIYEECMQALGRTYHPEHFMCSSCNNPLGTGNFFELAGTPHCQRCYQIQFCPKCAHCNQAISDRCVTALDKKWHVNCFVCTQCTSPFSGNFFERDGRPYCDKCFHQVFAPRCRSCNLPVLGDCVNALGAQWHPDHFNCQFCHKAFTGTFFEYEGMPYCEAHYYQKMGSQCAGCQQPIAGACVDALGKKWHPEHFVCAFCMNKLEGTAYSEKNTKPYCRGCFGKLFGS